VQDVPDLVDALREGLARSFERQRADSGAGSDHGLTG
jgi:hypothetical protein